MITCRAGSGVTVTGAVAMLCGARATDAVSARTGCIIQRWRTSPRRFLVITPARSQATTRRSSYLTRPAGALESDRPRLLGETHCRNKRGIMIYRGNAVVLFLVTLFGMGLVVNPAYPHDSGQWEETTPAMREWY